MTSPRQAHSLAVRTPRGTAQWAGPVRVVGGHRGRRAGPATTVRGRSAGSAAVRSGRGRRSRMRRCVSSCPVSGPRGRNRLGARESHRPAAARSGFWRPARSVLSFLPHRGAVAQLVARLVRNEKARGSNPLSSTRREPRPTSTNVAGRAGFRRCHRCPTSVRAPREGSRAPAVPWTSPGRSCLEQTERAVIAPRDMRGRGNRREGVVVRATNLADAASPRLARSRRAAAPTTSAPPMNRAASSGVGISDMEPSYHSD